MIWEDPPRPTPRAIAAAHNAAVLAELKANPGRWAKVAVGVSTGQCMTWTRAGCEVSRVGPTDKTTIYARWPEVQDLTAATEDA